jgi:hypothetical protein
MGHNIQNSIKGMYGSAFFGQTVDMSEFLQLKQLNENTAFYPLPLVRVTVKQEHGHYYSGGNPKQVNTLKAF